MDTNEFQKSLLATSTAYVPITAVHTSEIDTVIEEVVKFGLTTTPRVKNTGNRVGRTMVWRVSEGYREYKLFAPTTQSNGMETILPIDSVSGVNDPKLMGNTLCNMTQTIIKPEDEYGDANVEFALQFIEDWKAEENKERRKRCFELASKKSVAPIQLALSFVLNQKFPSFPLIGPRNFFETESSLEAIKIDLTDEEVSWLNLNS